MLSDNKLKPRSNGAENNARAPVQPKPISSAVVTLLVNLRSQDSAKREHSLTKLSALRESTPELALYLWHSYRTIPILLKIVFDIYPRLSQVDALTTGDSNRVCAALALLQSIASHPDTKPHLIQSNIPLYLYPFLNTVSEAKPIESLRLTSLGVIGALIKTDDPSVVQFLIQTEILPICLRIMERGTLILQAVATFIVQKLLLDAYGLAYVCQRNERFSLVLTVLTHVVDDLVQERDSRLLKHVIKCFTSLAGNDRALAVLQKRLPPMLLDTTFAKEYAEHDSLAKCKDKLVEVMANGSN